MKEVCMCILLTFLQLVSALPLYFDGRTDPRYLGCLSAFTPPTTAPCDINWAVAATNVLTHRYCVQRDEGVELDGNYVAGCQPNVGCEGEYPDTAWNFLNSVGAPTKRCHWGRDANSTTPCPLLCSDGSPMTFYSSTKPVWLTSKMSIQLSIMMKGPVQSCFHLYRDFLDYTGGVYFHNMSDLDYIKRECVEVIGWGLEGTQAYWIGVGMLGKSWGMGGYFYYQMGQVGGIESEVVAADPDEVYS